MSKILIIEDEYDVSSLLVKRLSNAGYDAIAVSDGYQGIDLAHSEKPDLVILDLLLTVGGGFDVLKNLKSSVQTRHIPVVVLTGIKDEICKSEIVKEGVEAYIVKPYDPEALMSTIKNILGK